LETKQHRATADYFFSRHILLHDVGFGEVLDVVKFEFPVQNKHAQSAKYVGPLQHIDVDWTLSLTPCIKVGFSGQREEINFEEVLDRWTREHDARFAWKEFVVTKSFVDEESGEHRWANKSHCNSKVHGRALAFGGDGSRVGQVLACHWHRYSHE